MIPVIKRGYLVDKEVIKKANCRFLKKSFAMALFFYKIYLD